MEATLPPVELTAEQRAAVITAASLYVEACPGAGKTRVIMERFLRVAGACDGRRGVAAITFTNAAAEEVRGRCAGGDKGRGAAAWPHFIGTMDAFLARFLAVPFAAGPRRPKVVESWERIGVDVLVKDCPPVPLHRFTFDAAGDAHLEGGRLGSMAAKIEPHRDALQVAAARRRDVLVRAGYLAPADVRARAVTTIRSPRSAALGQTLAHRFVEVIVDEAQDSNDEDWQILGWLRAHGLPVVIVADPHQAIYEFRNSLPAHLHTFTRGMPAVRLTGNFRSSPVICGAAATLRPDRPGDRAIGERSGVTQPVVLLPHARVDRSVGDAFGAVVRASGVALEHAVVLAHSRKDAQRAVGIDPGDGKSASRSARLHRAVTGYHQRAASSRGRLAAISAIERLVLELGGEDPSGPTDDVCERLGVSPRWLRRAALGVAEGLRDDAASEDVASWHEAARARLCGIDWPAALVAGRSPRFPVPTKALGAAHRSELRADTVHGVKGQEFEAVLLVLPRGQPDRESILDAWRAPNNQEALRVGYVAVTRARTLLALSPPRSEVAWFRELFGKAGVPVVVPGEAAPAPRQVGLFGTPT